MVQAVVENCLQVEKHVPSDGHPLDSIGDRF